jgi:hypothetical protein
VGFSLDYGDVLSLHVKSAHACDVFAHFFRDMLLALRLPNLFRERGMNDSAADRLRSAVQKGELIMTRIISLLLLGAFAFAVVGCEAHAKVDDNGAKAGVTVDK